jgi:hypothetical protein
MAVALEDVAVERMDPDAWKRVRAIRIRALRNSSDAFWVTADEEAATTATEWHLRLARPDAATFVAVRGGADVGLSASPPTQG